MKSNCADPELGEVLEDIHLLLQQNLPFDDFRRLYAAQMHLQRGGSSHLSKTKKFLLDTAKGKTNLSVHCSLLLGLLEAYELNLEASIDSLREAKALSEQYGNTQLTEKAKQLVEVISERKRVYALYSTALDATEEIQQKESIKNLALREACQYLTVAQKIIKKSLNDGSIGA
ncbi:MAG: hypothetical protein ACE5OZ_09195 [Candidatus Heimdallarchaeota archaeon]